MRKNNNRDLTEIVKKAKEEQKQIMRTPPSIYSFGQAYRRWEERRLSKRAIKYGNYGK